MAIVNGAGKKLPVPQVKLTVSHSAPTVGAAARGVSSAAKNAGKPPKQPGQPRLRSFTPLQWLASGNLPSSQQLAGLANRVTAQQTNASLTPLRQQAAQIRNTEGTVGNRLAGYYQTGDRLMGQLQGNATQGALTDENAAAQAAQRTANLIDQTGSAAQALNGGYMDPNVAAALQQQRQYQGTTAGAEAGLLGGLGTSENEYMANLRASAALGAMQGQQNVASIYGKQLGSNQAARNALLEKEAPTAKQLASSYGQNLFTDYATMRGLGLKQSSLAADIQNNQQRNTTAATNAATAQYRAQTQRQYDQAQARIRTIDAQLKQAGLSETQRHHLVTERQAQEKIANANKPKPALTPAAQAKLNRTAVSNVTGQEGYYRQAIREGRTPQQAAGAVTQSLKNDGAEAQAAIQLATQGYINPDVERQLRAQGVQVPKAWTAKRPPSQKGQGVKGGTGGPAGTTGVSGGG